MSILLETRQDASAPASTAHRLGSVGIGLLCLVLPGVSLAHSSVDEVAADIRKTERYLELVDRNSPPFVLSDTDGRPVSLADFSGKVVVLNFIYARCPDVCPLHSALLARSQQQLRAAGLVEGVQFVSIATDTEALPATVDLMRRHGTDHGLDSSNWIFLHRGAVSQSDATVRLAERYGLQFTPTPGGTQMHGVVTHIIAPDGRLRARFHGLGFATQSLVIYVAALLHGNEHGASHTGAAHGSVETRDPAGNQEPVVATRIRLLIGALGLALALWALFAWRRERRGP